MQLALVRLGGFAASILCLAASASAQRPGGGGRGGFGGVRTEAKLVQQLDKDGDGRLNAAERRAALAYLGYTSPANGSGQQAAAYNPKLSPAAVKSYSSEPLYDLKVLRTIFLEFEDADWERQLARFKGTDIDLPAKATVDGKTYPEVGVHFHGSTSYSMVAEGYKRSFSLSFDFANKKQQLYGYRTLHLLNSAADQTFLRSVLYMQAARDYMPAPLANFMRVVINGETWGVYANVEQFNSDLTKRALRLGGRRTLEAPRQSQWPQWTGLHRR